MAATYNILREQLINRRRKLEESISEAGEAGQLVDLLQQVDKALEGMESGSYGICEVCHDRIEPERLLADPLACVCLDHLSGPQARALEQDLGLARQIQLGLLPKRDFQLRDWQVSFHYEPAGLVSGDYCDLVKAEDGGLYFIVGDVSGKGIAPAMLMANLHAMFRALISVELPLEQMMRRANRMFCESTLAAQFATLVCGKARPSGEVDICNAGHLPPIIVRGDTPAVVKATGLPLGLFCDEQFELATVNLAPGDTLLLYTDGLVEAEDRNGAQYGRERLSRLASAGHRLAPDALLGSCLDDWKTFRAGASRADDLTVMAIRWAPAEYSLAAAEKGRTAGKRAPERVQ